MHTIIVHFAYATVDTTTAALILAHRRDTTPCRFHLRIVDATVGMAVALAFCKTMS